MRAPSVEARCHARSKPRLGSILSQARLALCRSACWVISTRVVCCEKNDTCPLSGCNSGLQGISAHSYCSTIAGGSEKSGASPNGSALTVCSQRGAENVHVFFFSVRYIGLDSVAAARILVFFEPVEWQLRPTQELPHDCRVYLISCVPFGLCLINDASISHFQLLLPSALRVLFIEGRNGASSVDEAGRVGQVMSTFGLSEVMAPGVNNKNLRHGQKA